MAPSQPPGRRRRARRGSVERPVNGRLYRGSFLLLSLPVLIAAFTVQRPAPLQAPQLPPAFDGAAVRALVDDLTITRPDRSPGTSGSLGAANWFRDKLRPYGLPTHVDSWREDVPGLGGVRLENLTAVASGESSDAIVVMAHRDDTGVGPGANDNGTGTAALVELARLYARPQSTLQPGVRTTHTLVFLSTDGGSFGGLGALRFVEHSPFRDRVVAVVNLDALAGPGPPRLEYTGDLPRSPAPGLVETAATRILEQTGARVRHPGFLGQLVDLGFPFTLYEQGPFVARGIPAVTLTTGGNRPPPAFGDTAGRLRGAKLEQMGRAAQELLGSLDQGLELAQGTTSYVWVGDRMIRGWAVELVLIALLLPFLVAAVDLFARCRRRRVRLTPALRALRSRLAFWAFVGVLVYLFRLTGALGHGPARPPNPATAAAGDWPALALVCLLVLALAGWLVERHRLVPRRPTTADDEIAAQAVALLALSVVALLVVATNPFGLLFALPALHAWLWLPQVRMSHPAARAAVFAAGLAGPALVLASLAFRFGLGLDAPWYLLELVALGYVTFPPVALALAGTGAAAQLVAVAAGRYAPYPEPEERGPRGPIREVVRTVVLAVRARRRVSEPPRRALGG